MQILTLPQDEPTFLTSFQPQPPCPDCLMMSQCLSSVSLVMRHVGRWASQAKDIRKIFCHNELLSRLPHRRRPASTRPCVSRHRAPYSFAPRTAGCLDDKFFNFSSLMVLPAVCCLWHGLCSAKSEFSTGIIPAVDPEVSLRRTSIIAEGPVARRGSSRRTDRESSFFVEPLMRTCPSSL